MLKVIYIYALMAFAFMRETFDPEEGMQCEYVWQCLITGVRSGLMSGGGLGEALAYAGVRSVPLFGEHSDMVVSDVLRVFFDLSFFIIVTTIGLNVVFGIIIDTFSELREEKSEVDEAIKTKCFICGFQDFEFERNDSENGGWSNHRDKDHNIWNYLMFINHVAVQVPTDYTYMESIVAEQLVANKVDWMPIGRALGLQGKLTTGQVGAETEASAADGAEVGDGDGIGEADGTSNNGNGGSGGGGGNGGSGGATSRGSRNLFSKLDALHKTIGGHHATLQAVNNHVATLVGNEGANSSRSTMMVEGLMMQRAASATAVAAAANNAAFPTDRLQALEAAVASQQAATAAVDAKLDRLTEMLHGLVAPSGTRVPGGVVAVAAAAAAVLSQMPATAQKMASRPGALRTDGNSSPPPTRTAFSRAAAPSTATRPTFRVRKVASTWIDSAKETSDRDGSSSA